MGKRRGNKHASQGVIGKPLSFNPSKTTEEEKELRLERGKVFYFVPAITAKGIPMNGPDQKEVEAQFSRATFVWSDGTTFFFMGRQVDKKKQHVLLMTFGVSKRELKSHTKLETPASLGEMMEGEG